MKTTLNKIMKHDPCYSDETLAALIKEIGGDTEISPMQIFKRVGIADTVWCLRAFDYRDYCLFNADVAETVLHIFEERYPDDKRPRQHLDNIRKWHNGGITKGELETSRASAYATASAAAPASARASAYATARAAAPASARASAYATARAAARASASVVAAWKEIEALFIKHFGE